MIGPTGRCTQCPGKCYFDQHFSQRYRCDSKEVKKVHAVNEEERVRKRLQALIEERAAEYKHVQAEVDTLIASYAKCLYRPKETPLMPHRSTLQHIDMLTEGEKAEAKLGWKRRVCSLTATRDKAEYMTKEEGEVIGFQCCSQGQRKSKASDDSSHETDTKRPRLEQDQHTPATTKTAQRRTH
ncbi:hypothetical protein GBF38_015878 [Nibea albiflora]|uniref:Uncharacterized protein n=1 Tax=Nibea albiflora TaxID=240163 RepID=A0ACB7FGV4_NIBAL|nr:hypothetical protein GBF38_015878 [Nibea albiflora]